MNFFPSLLENFSIFFSADPSILLVQSFMASAAFIIIFLVLFATRDILLRTHSFPYQIFCILLVAALPLLGFLFYLLIRPSRTLCHLRLEYKLDRVLELLHKKHQEKPEKKK